VKRGKKKTLELTSGFTAWNFQGFRGISSLSGISWTVIAIKRFVLLWKKSKAASTKVTKAEVRAP